MFNIDTGSTGLENYPVKVGLAPPFPNGDPEKVMTEEELRAYLKSEDAKKSPIIDADTSFTPMEVKGNAPRSAWLLLALAAIVTTVVIIENKG